MAQLGDAWVNLVVMTAAALGYNTIMDSHHLRANASSRVFRGGDSVADDDSWKDLTPAERIEAVWYLTCLCLAWNGSDDEPRLQRSVGRIQRHWR